MTWLLETPAAVEQGKVRDELERIVELEAEQQDGFAEAERGQIDAAIAAAEAIVDKAEFRGERVTVTCTGHVADELGEADAVSVLVSGPIRRSA